MRSPLRLSSFFTRCINSQACTTCPGELDCKVGRAQGGCSSEGCEVRDRSHYHRQNKHRRQGGSESSRFHVNGPSRRFPKFQWVVMIMGRHRVHNVSRRRRAWALQCKSRFLRRACQCHILQLETQCYRASVPSLGCT